MEVRKYGFRFYWLHRLLPGAKRYYSFEPAGGGWDGEAKIYIIETGGNGERNEILGMENIQIQLPAAIIFKRNIARVQQIIYWSTATGRNGIISAGSQW